MAESLISKVPSRAVFPSSNQRAFLLKCRKDLELPFGAMAELLKVSPRTLSDWQREKFSMSWVAVQLLSEKIGQQIPRAVEIRQPYWYVTKGARAGGLATYHRYGSIGDPEKRKRCWREWWEREGKFKAHPILNAPLPVGKPRPSEDLAELIGILLGDGGLTKYQIVVTLNPETDRTYINFVAQLVKTLTGVTPARYPSRRSAAVDIVVSRAELVRSLCTMGLRTGNKVRQQVGVPRWIEQERRYRTTCLRGLVDTDGSVFAHCYTVNGKRYCYPKLNFTNRSRPLLSFVHQTLTGLGFHPKIAYDNRAILLYNHREVARYFRLVGTHNPKHQKRYRDALRRSAPNW